MPTKQLRSPTKKHRATSPQVAAAVKALRAFIDRPLKPGKLVSLFDRLAAEGCELRDLQDAAAVLADQAAWQQTIEAICARLCDCTTEALSEEMSYDEVLQRAAKLEDEQARALLDAGFNDGWVA